MAKDTVTDHFPVKGASNGKSTGSQPLLHQQGNVIQEYGTVRLFPIALSHEARLKSCEALNGLLADSMILQAHYKKHHWLIRGGTFYQLHLLLDKHAEEQVVLIDMIAERIQLLGGVAVGDPRHAAELTTIPRSPDGVEAVPAMLSRLLEGHEILITKLRKAIELTDKNKDAGTNDMLMGDVLRTNEFQVWFIAEHLVDTPVVRV